MHTFDPQPFLQTSRVVATPDQLLEFLEVLDRASVIAVDTESAAFYKYFHVVNLIQIATPEAAAIIDPQALKDLGPLKEFAARSPAVWVMHGSGYDLRVLQRDFGIECGRLFDTRLAAEFLGMSELGMSSLCQLFLGFALNKKLQRCDWSRRPLTAGMREYALLDAICLVPIYEHLRANLESAGRLPWVEEECRGILRTLADPTLTPGEGLADPDGTEGEGEPSTSAANPYAFLIKGSRGLPPRALGVLKEVWTFRENLARRQDRAPFMVLPPTALLEIAQKAPQTMAGLATIKGLPSAFLEKHGRAVLDAVKTGSANPLTSCYPPRDSRRQDFLTSWQGEIAKTLREIRNQHANRLKMPAALLASGDSLNALSRTPATTMEELRAQGILRSWQVDILGEDFLEVLKKPSPKAPRRRSRRRR